MSIPLESLANGFILDYDKAKIGGRTLKNTKSTVTFLNPLIVIDGKSTKNPVIDLGMQIIANVSTYHVFGTKEDEKSAETLEKAELKFRRMTEEEIRRYYDAFENKENDAECIRELHKNNQLLCDVLDRIHDAGDDMFERIAKSDPVELGFHARNTQADGNRKKKRGAWVPPEQAEGSYYGIRKSTRTEKQDGLDVEVDLATPIYRIRIESAKKTSDRKGEILRATWKGGKKDNYVPYIFDRKKFFENMGSEEKSTVPLMFQDDPLTLANVDRAITRGSIANVQIAIDSFNIMPTGGSIVCKVACMYVDPCPSVEQEVGGDMIASMIAIQRNMLAKREVPDDLEQEVGDDAF